MKKQLLLLIILLLILTGCSSEKAIKVYDEGWFDCTTGADTATAAISMMQNEIRGFHKKELLGLDAYYICYDCDPEEFETWAIENSNEVLLYIEHDFDLYQIDVLCGNKRTEYKYNYVIGSGKVYQTKQRASSPPRAEAWYEVVTPYWFDGHIDFPIEEGMCIVVRSVGGKTQNIDTWEVYNSVNDAVAAKNCLYSITIDDYQKYLKARN